MSRRLPKPRALINAAREAGKEELNWFFPHDSLCEKSLLECVIPNKLGFAVSTISLLRLTTKISGGRVNPELH